MSTTVTYNNTTSTPFSKTTKYLKTAGTYATQDIRVTDTGIAADDYVYEDKDGFINLSENQGTHINVHPLSVTANGTYNASANEAYSSVNVAVPSNAFIKSVIDKSVTQVSASDLAGATSIGDYCFYECLNLSNINSSAITNIGQYAFSKCTSLASINLSNVSSIANHGFSYCSSLVNVSLPKLTTAGGNAFYNCTNIETLYLPKLSSFNANYPLSGIKKITSIALPSVSSLSGWCLADNTLLEKIDLGSTCGSMQGGVFRNTALNVLILRRSTAITTVGNINAFEGTPFASGGSGGTIYIPKTLYDALGTGTNDYKAATNWSTVDGYGTITWAPIEGSQYEHYYADGTPIE